MTSTPPQGNCHGGISIDGAGIGDLVYYDGVNWIALAIGTNGEILKIVGGVPSWEAAPSSEVTALTDLSDVTITTPSSGHILRYNGSIWVNTFLVAGDIPTLTRSKIFDFLPITKTDVDDTGTWDVTEIPNLPESHITNLVSDLAGKQPLDSDLTAIAALTPTNDDIIQRKTGVWTNRTIAQLKTDLAIVKSDISDFAHQSSHQSGGGDALSGLLDATARVNIRKNTGADIGARRRLNFIEGSNITLTITDDGASEEVDVTIAASGGGISDGDKGDITVSGSGATWTIDNDVVTFAQMQNIATARILGRNTAATGDIEELTASTVKTMLAIVKADISDFAHTHVKADITDTPWAKAEQHATTVYNDQANTYSGAGTQDFAGAILDKVGSLISNAAIPASAGMIRLGTTDGISWRNNGDTANNTINFANNIFTIFFDGANIFQFTDSVTSGMNCGARPIDDWNFLRSNATLPATSGAIRLGNNELVSWRNSGSAINSIGNEGTSINVKFGGVAKYHFFSTGVLWNGNELSGVGVYTDNSASPSVLGAIRLGNDQKIGWRNAGDTSDFWLTVSGADYLVMGIAGNSKYFFNASGAIWSGGSLTGLGYLETNTANPAVGGGFVRMARTDTVAWRNNANSANLLLGVDATDKLEFNGVDVSLAGHTHDAADVASGLLANARIATGTPNGTKFLRDDQVWAAPTVSGYAALTRINGASGAAGNDMTWQNLTADSADVTTTTLSSSVMSTTGVGAGTWKFKYTLVYQTAATGTGIAFAVNHTGTATMLQAMWYNVTTGGAAATGVGDNDTATVAGQMVEGKSEAVLNTIIGSASAGVGAINSNVICVLEGILVVTVSGTIELKIASEVASSAVRIMADSCLELIKIE